MQTMRFRATIRLEGKTATGFHVPPEIVEQLGRKRAPVVVSIGPHSYRSTVAAYNGVYMLPLAAEHREAAGVAAGDEVEVTLVPDEAPREVAVPPDFAAALDADPVARAFFDGLSYSHKRGFTVSIEAAKAPETRARRIEKAVAQMREGRRPA